MVGRTGGSSSSRKAATPPAAPKPWEERPWLFMLGSRSKPPLSYSPDMERALKKSWDLLLTHLDAKQQRDLCKTGKITITKPRGRVVVIAADGHHVNVSSKTPVGRATRYCTVSLAPVPYWDWILTQVLAVKYNWGYFSAKAHKM